ncbi:hypothetical protein GCM10009670_23170 [Citricoccus alkalitolerans]
MDVQLADSTVLLLGPGNKPDRVILRTLTTEGAWTCATQSEASTTDLVQECSTVTRWVTTEDELDARTVARLTQFLTDWGRPATAIANQRLRGSNE